MNTTNELQTQLERDLAWTCFKEWLVSENFADRAPLEVALAETSLWKEVEERKADHWQWWKGDDRGHELRELVRRVPQVWEEEGWATTETVVRGRPRRTEYSHVTLSKAHKVFAEGHQHETTQSTYKWAESVLGETVRQRSVYLVVVSASVYREFVDAVGEGELAGRTREELADRLSLSKPLANRLVRWLVSTGEWELKRSRNGEERKRVLRRVKQ